MGRKFPQEVTIEDEGVTQGVVSRMDFVGAGVSVTVLNGEATVTVTGGGGAGVTSTEMFLDFGTRAVAFTF